MIFNRHFLPPPRLPLRRHPSASTLAKSRTVTRGRDALLHRRGVFPITMSTPVDHPVKQHIELQDESDFDKLVSPDGLISICGFGSLLSDGGALFMMWQEISSLSVESCKQETLLVTVFEIGKAEVSDFFRRELEFRFLAVVPKMLTGEPFENAAVLCAQYSDEEFFNVRCKGSKEIYFQHYGRYNIDKIWRDDALPCRVYLHHCVLAAKYLGDAVYNNFLDHTYLANRKTTIRRYLKTSGTGIMEEEPSESQKTRYAG